MFYYYYVPVGVSQVRHNWFNSEECRRSIMFIIIVNYDLVWSDVAINVILKELFVFVISILKYLVNNHPLSPLSRQCLTMPS